jgi:hypothetical protein
MTNRIPKKFPTVDWIVVTITGDTMPPRDPNDDDDDDDDEDNEDNDTEDEPAVVREPDEDE